MKTYSKFIREHIFNEDLKDKSVLEFGPFQGYITNIIKDCSPSKVFTVEPKMHVAGPPHDYKGTANDFFKDTLPLEYDVVVCMGLLYHLHSPYHLLEQIINLCNPEKLIIETGGSYNDYWAPKSWRWHQQLEEYNTWGQAYSDRGIKYPIKVAINKGREQMVQAIETTPYKLDKYFVYKNEDIVWPSSIIDKYHSEWQQSKKDMWIGVFNREIV